MFNTPDRSCEVEIGKSYCKDESYIERKVKKEIEDLLESADPFALSRTEFEKALGAQSSEEKYDLVLSHFEKIMKIQEISRESYKKLENNDSSLSSKRRILLKFYDCNKEDEIFNKELNEIPEKLREEISQCKQVMSNLLNQKNPLHTSKLIEPI